ncbi:MAG: 5,5-dehydrodivanillate O-demethylase oxygenase subunit [Chloroflexota bacterium]|jgi:5,5'-dehydrodivanillate O-demethylase|nr:5,5-dehydrodivanillate O-demethylase oxygenase subunit [Chloroflexota bacterium]
MLKEENERLTRVGPGTPMGTLLRWYWHPVAASAQLADSPVRPVRILGEDLTLFRDRSGALGLIANRCAHRATGLWYGIPDADGLRCPYHGWKYDASGQCIDQPLEPPTSRYKEQIKVTAYPVQEMGGLIWAYLGPQPAPLLPRWDQFVKPHTFRHIAGTMLPCNWLQVVENGGDPNHGTYLHGHFYRYVLERNRKLGRPVPQMAVDFLKKEWHMGAPAADWDGTITDEMRHEYREIRAETYEYGQRKFMVHLRPTRDGAEHAWSEHTVVVFPYMRGGQIGVPIDDTHTWHLLYLTYTPDPSIELPHQDPIPYFEPPWKYESGEPNFSYITAQDELGWWSQGEITDRTREHLAYSDTAIIAYRQMLAEQLAIAEQGGEPMNVFRDPEMNDIIPMVPERLSRGEGGQARYPIDTAQFSPVFDEFWNLYQRDQALKASRREAAPRREPIDQIVECGCCVPLR